MTSLRKIEILFLVLFAVQSQAATSDPAYISGEVLVRYKDSVSDNAIQSLSSVVAPQVRSFRKLKLKKGNHYLLKTSTKESVLAVIERIGKDPSVLSAQPNFIYKTFAVPNDTFYGSMWGLKNTGQKISGLDSFGPAFVKSEGNPGTAKSDMSMESAWDRITDCDSTIVAVIDSGVDYLHEDLAANMWDGSGAGFPNHGYDTYSSDNNPMDGNGHGTHVAGTIGAVGNNAKGSVGICWKVKIMAVKSMSDSGSGSTATIAEGIDWAIDHGAKVINLSVGGASSDPILTQALEDARQADVVVVSAAGNDGTNNDNAPTYPCNIQKENTLCVAALTQTYGLAGFSNFGVNSVDVSAPGTNIVSSWNLTPTEVTDDFTAGWQKSSSSATTWGAQALGSGPTPAMTAPANWDGSVQYVNNTDARAYKSFDMSAFKEVRLGYGVIYNTGSGDILRTYCEPGAGDSTGGTVLDAKSGLTGSSGYTLAYDVSAACGQQTCTPGFQFFTNGSVTNTGIVLISFKLTGYSQGTTGYNLIRGTSMATPHVAGLAALLRSYNPDYKAADVVISIKNGGRSILALSVKTRSGKAVDALGSLSYIQPPSGVSAQAVP